MIAQLPDKITTEKRFISTYPEKFVGDSYISSREMIVGHSTAHFRHRFAARIYDE